MRTESDYEALLGGKIENGTREKQPQMFGKTLITVGVFWNVEPLMLFAFDGKCFTLPASHFVGLFPPF